MREFDFNGCRLVQMDAQELKDGEVCVKMLAVPINPSDINRIEGDSSLSICDVAGVIVEL
jgi:NADPH:quinone reductase-like Zn-dependent oxidoreductase